MRSDPEGVEANVKCSSIEPVLFQVYTLYSYASYQDWKLGELDFYQLIFDTVVSDVAKLTNVTLY